MWAEVKLVVPAVTDAGTRALIAQVSERVAAAEAETRLEDRFPKDH